MKRFLWVALALIGLAAQTPPPPLRTLGFPNGHHWRGLTRSEKAAYISGLSDGENLSKLRIERRLGNDRGFQVWYDPKRNEKLTILEAVQILDQHFTDTTTLDVPIMFEYRSIIYGDH
jgi:hypothetical protein